MSLENRVAVVTGGGRGIGRAIALRLARDGADLLLSGPEKEELETTSREVNALGRTVLVCVSDVRQEDQVQAMAEQARKAYDRIDILVNNAGIIGPTARVDQVTREEWDDVLAVNLTGAFLCCKTVVPDMIERRSGRIINISSVAGRIGYSFRSPYAVSKWGLIGLTRTLANELGGHNIQVNAICPGPVEGERMQAVFKARAEALGQSIEEAKRSYIETMALKRMVRADDVAALVAFLASDEAVNITGEALDVSAGYAL